MTFPALTSQPLAISQPIHLHRSICRFHLITSAGEMSGNQPHGWGTMVYKNGLCYEGSWSHGKEHGWGTISDPDDWTMYEGASAAVVVVFSIA